MLMRWLATWQAWQRRSLSSGRCFLNQSQKIHWRQRLAKTTFADLHCFTTVSSEVYDASLHCLCLWLMLTDSKAILQPGHYDMWCEFSMVCSFAPKTLQYSILKRIGELFPGPAKVTLPLRNIFALRHLNSLASSDRIDLLCYRAILLSFTILHLRSSEVSTPRCRAKLRKCVVGYKSISTCWGRCREGSPKSWLQSQAKRSYSNLLLLLPPDGSWAMLVAPSSSEWFLWSSLKGQQHVFRAAEVL